MLLDWMATGPDRQDLELYNRKSDGDEETVGDVEPVWDEKTDGDAADPATPESE